MDELKGKIIESFSCNQGEINNTSEIEISFYEEKENIIPFKKKESESKDTEVSESEHLKGIYYEFQDRELVHEDEVTEVSESEPLKGIYYEFQDGELIHEDEVTEELLSGYSPFTWKIVEYN